MTRGYYWNQRNFEGLLAASTMADARGLPGFAEYYRQREQGLRAQALTTLRLFVAQVLAERESVQRETAAWLAETVLANRHVHHLHAQPLIQGLIEPVLGNWAQEAGEALTPCRLLALLRRDVNQLRGVVAADPADDTCRRALAAELLRTVEFACHHLSENVFLGSEADVEANLQEAHKAIAEIADPDVREQAQREHDALALLVRDWADFQRERATGSFPHWCRRRGHTHSWWRAYYCDAR